MKPIIKIVNLDDNSEIEREMNESELKSHEIFVENQNQLMEIEKRKKEARESALAKLAALGLTEDEIAAL